MEEGEGGPNLEVRTDVYTLPCSYWEPAIKHRKLSLVLCDDPGVGLSGEWSKREEINVCIQLIHFSAQQRLA